MSLHVQYLRKVTRGEDSYALTVMLETVDEEFSGVLEFPSGVNRKITLVPGIPVMFHMWKQQKLFIYTSDGGCCEFYISNYNLITAYHVRVEVRVRKVAELTPFDYQASA
ncbi:hypothetical protein [Ktedonospora formicarum]|uniref:Uncharacterized protein n=1 Tax=Ktedonospora formicarum TaxID=2778364 RepID=A0A8J3I1W0_9CHLR|nr:hypothetical protein [Ktedonospora formicarum]GHO44538.1 hypothetical protein KSX_27010 [Ktedonospora formicarum]